MASFYGLSGKMTALPGKRDELLSILLAAANALEANPDCRHYVVGTLDDGVSIWINEVWTDKAAHDASLDPPEVRAAIMQAMPLLATRPEMSTEIAVLGGKGL